MSGSPHRVCAGCWLYPRCAALVGSCVLFMVSLASATKVRQKCDNGTKHKRIIHNIKTKKRRIIYQKANTTQRKKIILCAFAISGLQVRLLSPAPKRPQNGKRFGVFCCYRKCFFCGKTQENRERQKKRKSVEKVVDKCHFR